MIQNWSIRSRSHHCAQSGRAFGDKEVFHTAIYFDPETNGYIRRDVALDAWKAELAERTPVAYWRTTYSPQVVEARPEVTSKESAMALLQRFIEEDEPQTENARYILTLMLERKRILSPTATKDTEQGRVLFYENKKTSEVFMVRDPELRLDEMAQVQDEVAMLLGFGGPAAEAAKAVGMKFTPEGKLESAQPSTVEPATAGAESQTVQQAEQQDPPAKTALENDVTEADVASSQEADAPDEEEAARPQA